MFHDAYALGTYAQDVAVETAHASYLLNYWAIRTGLVPWRAFGRSGSLATWATSSRSRVGRSVRAGRYGVDGVVSLELAATGVAPFYYVLTPCLLITPLGRPFPPRILALSCQAQCHRGFQSVSRTTGCFRDHSW